MRGAKIAPRVRVTELHLGLPRSASGAGFSIMTPVGIVETRDGMERAIRVPDPTGEALRAMAIAAAVVWAVMWLVRRMAWTRS
jgi:hypothetical protein